MCINHGMIVKDPMWYVLDIKTTYRVCQHHCDKDLAYCILTCDNELKMENAVNVCEHTCHTYKEYCVAHCFN